MRLTSSLKKITGIGYFVALITFFTRATQFMTLPFLAIYLTHQGLLTASQIGLVLGISGFMLSVTSLFNGLYIDRGSFHNILCVSLILAGLCYFTFAFSMTTFYGLLLINCALGWFRSLNDISVMSMLVSNTKSEHLSYAYSVRFIAANFGVAIGPLIGALMANHNALFVFYIAAGIHFCLALGVYYKKPQTSKAVQDGDIQKKAIFKDFPALFKNSTLINITLINLILWTVYSQLDTTIPQYLAQSSQTAASTFSILMIVNAFICITLQPLIMRCSELLTFKISGFIGCCLFSISFLLFSVAHNLIVMTISIIAMTLGELFTLPMNGLLILRSAPKHLIASFNGFSNFGLIGLSIGPIIGGLGLSFLHPSQVFTFNATLPLLAAFIYLKMKSL